MDELFGLLLDNYNVFASCLNSHSDGTHSNFSNKKLHYESWKKFFWSLASTLRLSSLSHVCMCYLHLWGSRVKVYGGGVSGYHRHHLGVVCSHHLEKHRQVSSTQESGDAHSSTPLSSPARFTSCPAKPNTGEIWTCHTIRSPAYVCSRSILSDRIRGERGKRQREQTKETQREIN